MRSTFLTLILLLGGTDSPVTAQPPVEESKITVTVFRLKNAKASEVAETLAKLIGRRDFKPVVAADERNNSVLVSGDEEAINLARKIIAAQERGAKKP